MNLTRVKVGMVVEIKFNGYHAFGKVKYKHTYGKNISVIPIYIKSQENDGYIRCVGVDFEYIHYSNEIIKKFSVDEFKEVFPEMII